MKVRGFITPAAIVCALLTAPLPAGAHRLDEYLQATRLSIELDRVDAEMDLTPGSAMASEVFGWIDTDHDGRISPAEGDAYVRLLLGSVALNADGWPVAIHEVETRFPDLSEMKLGVGTIRVRATAKVPRAGGGRHQLVFLNTHRTESSVYLVNALVPSDPRIRITGQRRDRAQLGLTLDYTVASETRGSQLWVLLAGLVMAACFLLRRAHSRSSGTRG